MSSSSSIDYRALWQVASATLSSLSSLRISPSKIKFTQGGQMIVGGFGDVRQAELRTARFGPSLPVAVKIFRPEGDRNRRIRIMASLARELAVWRHLLHPNILSLEGFYYDESELASAWIVTAWLSNGNILSYLEKTKPKEAQRSKLALDAARGLAYLHGLKPPVCHGDVKAENMLVDNSGDVRLCDFGLSKVLEDVPTGLTTTKTTSCSLRYAAPELLSNQELPHTLASDVWAWGCVYLVIMSDVLPYHDKKRDITIRTAIQTKEPPADVTAMDIPKVALETLKLCWHQQPELRPTMDDCVAMFNPLLEEFSINPASLLPRPSLPSRIGPETVQSSNASLASESMGPSALNRTLALLGLLSAERAYTAEMHLLKDVHFHLSRKLPSTLEPTQGNHSSLVLIPSAAPPSPAESSHRPSSVYTASSACSMVDSAKSTELPMSLEASRRIFRNISEIAIFADRFANQLEDALGELLPNGEGGERVGLLFLEVLPVLQSLYTDHISRNFSAHRQFQSLLSSTAVDQYISQTQSLSNSRLGAQDIPTLLLKPVQRIAAYPLILDTICTHTPDAHPDKANLLEAKSQAKRLATEVEQRAKRWAVVNDALDQRRVGKAASPTSTTLRTRGRSSIVRSSLEDAWNRDISEVEVWRRRIDECETVVTEISRQVLEWNRELNKSLTRLKELNAGFGRVFGSSDRGLEPVGAFSEVVTGIQGLYNNFNLAVQSKFLPQLSILLRTVTSPRIIITHSQALLSSHITLMNMPYNKNNPPKALIEASNDWFVLQATLREELPQYFVLFEKGVGILVLELAKWQTDIFRQIKLRWIAFYVTVAGEGEHDECSIRSGHVETQRIWRERFQDVQQDLFTLRMITSINLVPAPLQHQNLAYRQANGIPASTSPLLPRSSHDGTSGLRASELISPDIAPTCLPNALQDSTSSDNVSHRFAMMLPPTFNPIRYSINEDAASLTPPSPLESRSASDEPSPFPPSHRRSRLITPEPQYQRSGEESKLLPPPTRSARSPTLVAGGHSSKFRHTTSHLHESSSGDAYTNNTVVEEIRAIDSYREQQFRIHLGKERDRKNTWEHSQTVRESERMAKEQKRNWGAAKENERMRLQEMEREHAWSGPPPSQHDQERERKDRPGGHSSKLPRASNISTIPPPPPPAYDVRPKLDSNGPSSHAPRPSRPLPRRPSDVYQVQTTD